MPREKLYPSRGGALPDELVDRALQELERIQHLILRVSQLISQGLKPSTQPQKGESQALPTLAPRFRPFGGWVKQLRIAKGMTLEQVARALGTHRAYISTIENGRARPPSPRFIAKLARLYTVDGKELLRVAYAEKAPPLIRQEVIRALWPQRRS